MDGTEEGRALAQAAREAALQRKRALEEAGTTDGGAAKLATVHGPAIKKSGPKDPLPPCTHYVALPENYDPKIADTLDPTIHGRVKNPMYKGPRAKSYPFRLDPFQEIAVACLERRESVLVAAHTSAGKTAVAEYAIAMSFRDKQRVIYTSPLKALSNQKFRELSEEFTDVGLMTGDVAVNPNASCIVMTTEILRSMIYRGSELLREIAWVIFDEVHYMQDRERGVVWEETIIFLPPGARMVFLSATLSNADEFSGWVASLHNVPCHVVYTDYRPTPLQHYAYACGGSGLHLILDDRGQFRSDNFAKVRATFELENAPADSGAPPGTSNGKAGDASGENNGAGGRGGRGRGGRGRGGRGGRGGGRGGGGKDEEETPGKQIQTILKVVKRLKWDPIIFFAFSRKECELQAGSLMKVNTDPKMELDKWADSEKNYIFNTEEEAAAVEEVYNAAMQCLSVEDQSLRAVKSMLPMLKMGIGVHHSGLLPILKEVVELLFSDSLIKVLFTTETFAMGLNMPARTVVFTQLRKWDGEQNRLLTSGEYIQMSGRAGRRGKDDRGLVIIMVNEDLSEDDAKDMCMGKPSPLKSSFKLSYYTMLNMMRRLEGGEAGMEEVIRKSFVQFQNEARLPLIEAELQQLEEQIAQLSIEGQTHVAQFQELLQQMAVQKARIQSVVLQPHHCLSFLKAGRLVEVRDGAINFGWGVVVNVRRIQAAAPTNLSDAGSHTQVLNVLSQDAYEVDVMLVLDSEAVAKEQPMPAKLDRDGSWLGAQMEVVPIGLGLITAISSVRLTLPTALVAAEQRRAVMLQLQELLRKFNKGLPLLDPIEDMAITSPELQDAMSKVTELETQLKQNPVYQSEGDKDRYEHYARMAVLKEKADKLRQELKTSQLQKFKTEVKNRTAVLKKLGHVDDDGVVTLKGRAACEIDTADELLTAELMFNGTLLGLDHASLVALVSCLIPVEKSGETIKLTTTMAGPLAALQGTAREIGNVFKECKLDVDVDMYVESFQPFLMDIMHAWSKGQSFSHICSLTDIYEGSIIRATRRLDELLQQLSRAAQVVGDTALAQHIEAANLTIRRDIIFAASLYI